MKKIKLLIAGMGIVLIFAACSSTKNIASVVDPVKSLTAPEGKALVYVVRPSKVGFLINFKVYCDNEFIGLTKGKTYIYAYIEPGQHIFMSQAENKDEVDIELEANKTYFLLQIPKMGLIKARNRIQVLDESAGRAELAKCKLAKGFVVPVR